MKRNEPITDREIDFPEGQILVSKTDAKGIITYANPAFVKISGFSEEELLGKNHNIVRHPHMPPEAFKDLWDTVKQGDTWTGLVKNRAKSGDYYWVKANVTPINLPDGGVEYMSVRTKPTEEEKRFAEQLYADVRAGRAKLPTTESRMHFWTLERILLLGGGGVLASLLALAGMVAAGLSAPWLYGGLMSALLFGGAAAWLLKRHVVEPLVQGEQKLRQILTDNYFDWMAVHHKGVVGQILQAIRSVQVKIGFEVLDNRRLADIGLTTRTAVDNVSTNVMMADADFNIVYMNRAVQEMFREAEQDIKEVLPHFDADHILGQSIDVFHKNPSHQRALLERLEGPYKAEMQVGQRIFEIIANPVINEQGERLGTVVEWKDLTEVRAAEAAEAAAREEAERRAMENLRIRTALDNVSSCVMMADTDNNIIYMNDTVREMFKRAEADIRKELPHFEADKLLGANIDSFHKNPAHQQRAIEMLDKPLRSEIRIGGRTFRFVANPVVDPEGNRLGTAVEWLDRTDEVAVEQELESIVAAARSGNLDERVTLEGKQGFFKHLAVGINALLDDLKRVVGAVDETLQAMAGGDFQKPMKGRFQGAFGRIRDAVNQTLVQVSETLLKVQQIADGINVASNEITSGNANLSARTEQQAAALEETASSMEQLTATVRHNADNAQQANQVTGNARQLAEQGGQVVADAVSAMEAINRSSEQIAEIIGVIDEIAFQTNLLALNASVEAARAGEQGRGFAVVATEVRNLASRSAEAAKEIKELIQDSVDKVHAGSDLVGKSGETLSEIVLAVKKVGDIVAEIAAASAEQAAGIDQVNLAVTSLDETTQQNAALAEETAAASSSLYEKAQEMERGISFFRLPQDPRALLDEAESEDADHAHHHVHGQGGDATLDFFAARTAHLAWRQKIRDFLDGRKALTHAEAVSHRDCVLGKWLYSQGMAQYGHIDEMQTMEKRHERLHAVIREIIDLKEAGRKDQAEQRYQEIESLSGEIVALLQTVEARVTN
ncbi:MAG: PAS domain-containing protein [Gammaproteobacteria bacterium]|nr:MAG: PAS domain-containing protein [Gammaproteobacteria bacterium]